ncbi:MAG: M20 family metallopeptidase [Actinomycetes bacterium]
MSTPTAEDLAALVAAEHDDMVAIRRDLHRHPELGFHETRTTAVIDEAMAALGAERLPCPTPTGSVWSIQGGQPGRTVMLRADIDALPITETADLAFASEVDGLMHACGHDAHVAQMIGAARALAARAEDLPGRHIILFQPAEEALGGAEAMIAGGVLDGLDVERVVGCHVASIIPTGMVGVRDGIAMADVRSVRVEVEGIGGHGAAYTSGANPLLAAAILAQRLGEVAADLTYEGVDCSCTAGVLHAGTAGNVIPAHAVLKGTLRTFTPEQTDTALARLDALALELTAETGCTFHVHFDDTAPAVRNDAGVSELVRSAATEVVRAEGVLAMPPVTPSDDVSFFLDRIPGCYFFVGAALADGSSGMHHNPGFAIDEGCLSIAARVLAGSAIACATAD